jgi:hypothetical protein
MSETESFDAITANFFQDEEAQLRQRVADLYDSFHDEAHQQANTEHRNNEFILLQRIIGKNAVREVILAHSRPGQYSAKVRLYADDFSTQGSIRYSLPTDRFGKLSRVDGYEHVLTSFTTDMDPIDHARLHPDGPPSMAVDPITGLHLVRGVIEGAHQDLNDDTALTQLDIR